jgi:hypothetical protein
MLMPGLVVSRHENRPAISESLDCRLMLQAVSEFYSSTTRKRLPPWRTRRRKL